MAMEAMPPQGAPAPEGGGEGKGASQLLADAHSSLMQLQELMGDKMPQEAQQLSAIVQAIQSFAEGMGAPAGQEAQGPAVPGTTSPEAGAANVQPSM